VFNVTKPASTPLTRAHGLQEASSRPPRHPRRALAVIAVGGFCAAIAACSSSSSSPAPAASSAVSAASSAVSAASSAVSAASSAASGVSAADCVIIKQVDSSAISTLLPMQSESKTKAAADLQTYLTQLAADEAKLTSAKGKSVLSAWIADVQKAATESTTDATTTITGGLGALGSACP
jgi:ABC-type transporter Mla MlaB component